MYFLKSLSLRVFYLVRNSRPTIDGCFVSMKYFENKIKKIGFYFESKIIYVSLYHQ